MNKLLALLDLFRKGSRVADVELWKSRQISSTMIAVFIIAGVKVANLFGVNLPIDEDAATAIAAGIIAIVNVVLTYITTNKIGILPSKPAEQPSTEDTAIERDVPKPEADVPAYDEAAIAEAQAALAKRHTTEYNDMYGR